MMSWAEGMCFITGALSIYMPDPSVWRTPQIREQGFQFEIQISSLGTCYDPKLVRASIQGHDLGESESAVSSVIAAEWGYSFTHLDGQQDGAGRRIQGGYPTPPASRAECLQVIEAFLHRQYIQGAEHPWASMNGHFPWHHYSGQWEFDQIGSEIGENINNYQWHIALTRGAARQYGRPWFMDFSAWHGPGINDVSDCAIWGEYSHPDHGHSMSLFERSLFLCYMAGAGQITAEAGGALAFLTTLDERGYYELSAYGQVCKRLRDFSLAYPDIGIPCTPFAVVLDREHGAYPGFGERKAFGYFEYEAGDIMTWDLIDKIWPGGWEVMNKEEVGTLVHGPYGDTFDILLQDAPQPVLNSYPCLILSGEIRLSDEEKDRYLRYVEQGGTLILNTIYLEQFPEYKPDSETRGTVKQGMGRGGDVLVYSPDYCVQGIDSILRQELAKRLPVRVAGDIQYLVNIAEKRVFVTLINNAGVTKAPRERPVIDSTQGRNVTAVYQGPGVAISFTDIKNQKPLTMEHGKRGALFLAPGEVVVLEVAIKDSTR